MKLRIRSDGTVQGTFVENEAGEPVENILSIRWSADGNDTLAAAVITLMPLEVDVGVFVLDQADAEGNLTS